MVVPLIYSSTQSAGRSDEPSLGGSLPAAQFSPSSIGSQKQGRVAKITQDLHTTSHVPGIFWRFEVVSAYPLGTEKP